MPGLFVYSRTRCIRSDPAPSHRRRYPRLPPEVLGTGEKVNTCDGWAPFMCRAKADWKVYKGGSYIADLCGGHKPDAVAFGGFTFKKIKPRRCLAKRRKPQ